jgi:hypothetical protein
MTDADLFGTDEGAISDAFILRVVRGLARIAGAALVTSPGSIALSFPRG